MAAQADLFQAEPKAPDGFSYRPDLITPQEEQALVAHMEDLDFQAFRFHGYIGKRCVVYFGWRYDFSVGRVGLADPIPDWLEPLRGKAAGFAGLAPAALEQALINQYPPGAPIGWHRDRPQFGEVVGVSLLSPARLRMRRETPGGWERWAGVVEPRSVYHLSGPARTEWEHSIPPATHLRYSVTFRTLR